MLKMLRDKLKITALFQNSVTADQNITSVDLQDYNSCAFIVHVAAFTPSGTDKIAIELEESDDNSSFTDVAATDMAVCASGSSTSSDGEASTVAKTIDDGAEDDTAYIIHYRGAKRYARVVINVSGTVDTEVAVSCIRGNAEFMPV